MSEITKINGIDEEILSTDPCNTTESVKANSNGKSETSQKSSTAEKLPLIENARKSQKNFEAAKLLKVFLKNTAGDRSFQKEILRRALKLDNKEKSENKPIH